MLGKLKGVFQRYAEEHLDIRQAGADVLTSQGHVVAQLETIALRRQRLWVSGTTQATEVGLATGREPRWVTPDNQGRFSADIPFEEGAFTLHIRQTDGVTPHRLMGFSARHVRMRRALLWGRYLWDLTRLVPQIWRWRRHGDLVAREVIKERLGIVPQSPAGELDPAVFAPLPVDVSQQATPPTCATIVMPVYNAFDVLCEALERVAAHSGDDWRLILIEDCSSDTQVRPYVQDWAARHGGRVTLLLNDSNQGFIGAVNRGFESAKRWPQDPVVLLNSDALVPQGWLPRLLAPLTDPQVASVTPMSNDAEIFTVPVICQRLDLQPGVADVIDQYASRLPPDACQSVAPTGVGFCMAVSPRFLSHIPVFDTVFGRGYGEETDWCQKARALGGRHVGVATLFVEHRGGESFGSAAKQQLLERNSRVISSRYPAYDGEVHQFLREDPMNTPRLALAAAWAGAQQQEPVHIYLGHAWGGGAEHYLQHKIAAEVDAGRSAVVVRVGQGYRWRIEVHCASGITQGVTDDWSVVAAVIGHLPRRRIIYSCGVGDRNAVQLPDLLCSLAVLETAEPHPVEVLVHDFFPISPSYTLLDAEGGYQGVPLAGSSLANDPAHRYVPHRGAAVSLDTWQQAWGRLLQQAERIVAFSDNSRRLLLEVYPDVHSQIVVEPHSLSEDIASVCVPKGGTRPQGMRTIGVLGNIGPHKGAFVLERLSKEMQARGNVRLVLLGHLAPEAALAPPSVVHGAYQLRDVPDLVARYGVEAWLMPSIWPETFSFTTHEMLATGLPVMSFDLGAQGDAVRTAIEAGHDGCVLPLDELNSGHLLDEIFMMSETFTNEAEAAR